MAGRYYWLKLHKDFFGRHDIRLLDRMPDGKEYIIFYQKLLLESLKSEGVLMFNGTIPYTNDMLAAVTSTEESIVDNAMELFIKFNMIERHTDGAIYITDTNELTGSEAESTRRVRKHREKKALHCNGDATKSNTEIEKEKEKDTEIELEEEKEVENAPVKGLPRPHSRAFAPMDAIDRAWHEAKMSPMSTATRKSINDYIKNGMDSCCVEYAILEADRNDARSFAYINGVLKRLRDGNITTREALERDKKHDKKAATGRREGELPENDYFRLHNSWDEL